MQIKIKKIDPKNHNLIGEINKKIFPYDDLWIDHKTTGWIAYNEENEAVAFCTARSIGHKILFMDRGGVLPKYRNLGIHRKLIRVRENFAKNTGIKKIITYVQLSNYCSMFTLVRTDYQMYTPHYKYAGSDVIYFIKELDL